MKAYFTKKRDSVGGVDREKKTFLVEEMLYSTPENALNPSKLLKLTFINLEYHHISSNYTAFILS